MPKTLPCNKYSHLIPSLTEQVEVLKQYLTVEPELLAQLNRVIDDGAPQRIDDCKVVVVWLSDLRTTVQFYQQMAEQRQVEAGANPNWYGVDFSKLRMELDKSAYQYPEGKFRVYVVSGLNLLDNWDPENGSSVEQARQTTQARQATGEQCYLASFEALALYAMAPKLYQAQNGKALPFYDLAGIRSGDDLGESPCSLWYADDREVSFLSYGADLVYSGYAQPSFRGITLID